MHRTTGNYILIPHKLHQLFVQYRLKEYYHQLGITLFQMVKLAKIGYVRVRSECHLTVSRKMTDFILRKSTDGLSLPSIILVTATYHS